MTFNPKVYMDEEGLNVRGSSGGKIKGEATAGANPAQAAHIADYSAPSAVTGIAVNGSGTTAVATVTEVNAIVTNLGTLQTKLNAALAALENAGLLAKS